jgi:phosphate transport system protein
MEGHTVQRYDGELNHLHLLVLEMGGLVLDQVRLAINALKNEDLANTNIVLDREHKVDELEIKIDEELVSVLARRSPMARDLRILMSFSKAVADLERVGDEAARIAHLTAVMIENNRSFPGIQLMRDVQTMGALAVNLFERSLDIFDTLQITSAEELIRNHSELDAEFRSSLRRIATFVLEDARNVGHAINITLVIKALERIGDHARNLVEYVIYLVNGEDVRHRWSKREIGSQIDSGSYGQDKE